MLSRKFQFYLGIVNTFPAVFYIFLGIFSAFMHKISHSASPREKFYAFWQRKCQEKCRKQLEKWWQFLGKISTCLTLLPHVGNLYSEKRKLRASHCMYRYALLFILYSKYVKVLIICLIIAVMFGNSKPLTQNLTDLLLHSMHLTWRYAPLGVTSIVWW